ncbi:MAG TPA: glycosyl hydrolase family 18 protein [Candidatus Binatia bacterium]|nr:glycosyl hydrolase family 18 protein [Candidatus Binatia bacterium]
MNRTAAVSAAVLVLVVAVVVAGSTAGIGSAPSPTGSGSVAGSSPSPAPSPLGSGAVAHRPREAFGFLPYWSMASWTDGYLRYDLLTTIAFFGVGVRDDGSIIRSGPGYTAFMSDRATTIIDHAHAAGVRVVITFESFGTSHNHRFLPDPVARQQFVDQAAGLVAERGIDGTNLDVEGVASADIPSFGLLVAATASRFHTTDPASEVTVSTNGNVSGARMAAAAIGGGADRAFLMGYSYRVPSTVTTGSVGPISAVGATLDIASSLDLYDAAQVPPDRILLGLPYFGLTWPTVSSDLHAARQPDSAKLGRGVAFRPRYLTAAGPPAGSVLDHDPIEPSARYTWFDQTKKSWYQTYFDDPQTLAVKENVAVEQGLAGVGLWSLGDDYGVPGYWETLAATLGLGPPYVPPSASPAGASGGAPTTGASAGAPTISAPASGAPSPP